MILHGDSLTHLKELPEKSINMCMTSPPYWALRDYGTASWEGGSEDCDHQVAKEKSRYDNPLPENSIQDKNRKGTDAPRWKDKCPQCGAIKVDNQLGLEPTFEEYISKLCNIFDEVKRVLRDDGTCWVNIGDTYANTGRGHKPEHFWNEDGSPKNKFSFKYEEGKVPTDFPKTYTENPLSQKCLSLIPFRFAIEMVNRGWILRNTIIWHKRNCMPSSVKDRFTVDFEYLFFFSKKKKYYFETQYEPSVDEESYTGRKPRYSLSIEKRDPLHNAMSGFRKNTGKKYPNRIKRTVWTINPKPFKESHFAVYPEELCETPIKAGCIEGGVVLDPFFGAGTTGVVALKQNKKFIGIELNEEYIQIAKKRLKPYLEQTKLK